MSLRDWVDYWISSILAIYSLFSRAHNFASKIIHLKDRRFRIIKQLGEGGYAFVYLVLGMDGKGENLAIKKIVAQGPEKLQQVHHEIQIHSSLKHPHILPLIDSDIKHKSPTGYGPITQHLGTYLSACKTLHNAPAAWSQGRALNGHVHISVEEDRLDMDVMSEAYLMFPAYLEGNLAEEVDRLTHQMMKLSTPQICDIFIQLCEALKYLHDTRGIAHLDVKPHNILISKSDSPCYSKQSAVRRSANDPLEPEAAIQCQQAPHDPLEPEAAIQCQQAPHINSGNNTHISMELVSQSAIRQLPSSMTCNTGRSSHHPSSSNRAASTSYHIALMDFGSARQRQVYPTTRREALSIQEAAEANCTATYRAPELFDVPTGQVLDYAKCDIWAAGCTLYHAMYGCSPFQRAADQSGGSIALAVMNCSIPWPKVEDTHKRYSQSLHTLVTECLVVDPNNRPDAATLINKARDIMLLYNPQATCSS
ncbi:hypothetical protein CEUSTIGMA_g6046.t1 [Chlamydomonas eustigma]|uniref:non-specific serine/threonine protein kinase n=1 Tax=Chlamydomonas eustigma TaxID=1157962 RepID=A0A250X6B3_9CHLO|nr:hypothetical protein CEUSTIGMA_g6046.t1 [Chlamydomonas eustigma]|eukprot:GAX78607.1 hypothetical protein CEUSTIGMA_g6046.t1 [Chlamydomonas eustigma]